MEPTFLKHDEVLYQKSRALGDNGENNKALEILDDLISANREHRNSWLLHFDQGMILSKLAGKAKNTDLELPYTMGAAVCYSRDVKLSSLCARLFHVCAVNLGSVFFYKNCVEKAKQGLSLPPPDESVTSGKLLADLLRIVGKKRLEGFIEESEIMIANSKTSSIKEAVPQFWEFKKSPEPIKDKRKGLRSYWLGLDVKIKRDFMKVSIEKLRSFVQGVHKREAQDALEQVLASAEKDRKWKFWMCRTLCLKKFSSAEECKTHLEQQHAADYKPSSEMGMAKRIGKDWTRKISVQGWQPVDTAAAVQMIKTQLEDVKAFTSKSKKNGWSKEWPLAQDEERSNLLEEIQSLLVSLCHHEILSCSIRDWMMRFPVKHLGKLEVSEQSLRDCHLLETPQSICFLECHELNKIRDFLKNIKCERVDGTDLVCQAVDNFLSRTRVKQTIDFDPQFSFILLDKRLLKSNNAPFDDKGTINVFDPSVHYAKAHAQGDDIISWLLDYSSEDKSFPKPIREHNLDIWLTVLRVFQFTCRTLGTKYAKKVQVLDYDAALTVFENLCMSEGERRKNLQKDQWNGYASLLCDRCEESVAGDSLTTKSFLRAARDVFEEASRPTFDSPDLEDSLKAIRERRSLSDDRVLKSIHLLKSY